MILRDSVDAPLIPRDTPVVAGYGDGSYMWSPSWKASGGLPAGSNWFDLFPNAVRLVIVVNAANAGDILDVESGDATPAQVPGWCRRFNRPGRRAPTVYCNRDTWPLVIAALQAAGIDPAGPDIDWWISTLDGTVDVPVKPGGKAPALVQYVDTGAYDESVIHDPSWVGAVPSDPLPPVTAGGDAQVAIAPRMDGQGVNVDVIRVTPEGHVEWQGNTPYWVLGAWTRIYTAGVDGSAAVLASAAWVSPDALLASVIFEDGQNRQNALTISGGWRFQSWEQNDAPFRVVKDGAPGPQGDPGPASTVVPKHDHPITVSGTASLSGTSGPPA